MAWLFALIATSIVSAATFNYVADVVGNEKYYASYVKVVDGITVTARGDNVDNSAGLSIGKTNTINCGSDNNVTDNKKLTLLFNHVVNITQINMINGDHLDAWVGNFGLSIDGGAWQTIPLASIFNTAITRTVFEFWNNNNFSQANNAFYISSMSVSAVPFPAALWLFGSVLLSFTAMRRNAKVAAQAAYIRVFCFNNATACRVALLVLTDEQCYRVDKPRLVSNFHVRIIVSMSLLFSTFSGMAA